MNERDATGGMWVPVAGEGDVPEAIRREGAWAPRPLPSHVVLATRTHRGLARAEQALGRLDEAAERLPDRSYLVDHTMLREAQSSAALEDACVSLTDVLLARLPGAKPAPEPAVEAIIRYLEASRRAFGTVRDGADIDLPLLGEISRQLGPVPPPEGSGFWRERTSWISGRDGTPVVAHTPPGPHLQATAQQWQEWVRAEHDLPLVAKVAIGHPQLELIHPFAGGNGYVARLYVSLELVRAGVLRDQILPLSRWLDRYRDEYYQKLRAIVDTGSFEEFMVFFAEGVDKLCTEQINLIKRMEKLRTEHLKAVPGAGNARRVASELIGMPVTNHQLIAQRFDISIKGATDVAKKLQRAGLLTVKDNAKYKKTYIAHDVLELLSSLDPVPPTSDDAVFG
ncbi:Fic/DOC family N-terminal domain-containing protein [Amycolatopsis sp. QT-25]|uniref:Fic family protein n=1 Tax=Amycolatopsis sp. QT-25 TaxID=3034022 RepID=UPI00320AB0A1